MISAFCLTTMTMSDEFCVIARKNVSLFCKSAICYFKTLISSLCVFELVNLRLFPVAVFSVDVRFSRDVFYTTFIN